jgi:hypothetical protein
VSPLVLAASPNVTNKDLIVLIAVNLLAVLAMAIRSAVMSRAVYFRMQVRIDVGHGNRLPR